MKRATREGKWNQLGARHLIAAAFVGLVVTAGPAAAQDFTDWGWPQPYEKVSDKSVAWLKEKGWWPIGVGWQGPFSGQNTINVVMDKDGLLGKRGIEAKFQTFAAGPEVNEAVAVGAHAGRQWRKLSVHVVARSRRAR